MFQNFGFQSGKDIEKFASFHETSRAENGVLYLTAYTNSVISAKVVDKVDYGTHTLFIAEVTEAKGLTEVPSVTYQYYFEHIKPQPQVQEEKKGFVCKVCGYVYEGDSLPEDFICPICKHGVSDFEPLK